MEIDKGVTMLVHSEPYELLILGCSCNPSTRTPLKRPYSPSLISSHHETCTLNRSRIEESSQTVAVALFDSFSMHSSPPSNLYFRCGTC
jgi:hypothetical protein